MRTPAQAVSAALAAVRAGTYYGTGRCCHVVGLDYGLAHSGYDTAYHHATSTPSAYRHGWSPSPPSGALVFWAGGSRGAGHEALSIGSGRIVTTDLVRPGRVNVVPIGDIQAHWGLPPLFWTDAWFGSQGVQKIVLGTPAIRVSLSRVIAAAEHDAPAPGTPKLHPLDVLPVERALNREGLLAVAYVDGSYGTSTIAAYAAWQRRLGYSGADANGIPGLTSLTALGHKHGFAVVA